MDNVNFTAFDIETAFSQGNICQLGIVVVRKGKIVEEKSFLIQPIENKYSNHCTRIHGIKASDTKNAPFLLDIWDNMKEYFEKQVVYFHSTDGFDHRILFQDLDLYKIEHPRFLSINSTSSLFSEKHSRSLSNLCKSYSIEMEQHHDAVSDARCCALLVLNYLNYVEPDYTVLPQKADIEINNNKQQVVNPAWLDEKRIVDSATKIQDLTIVENTDTLFYDKKIVISGVFERYPLRNDLAKLLKNYGADINGSISGKTDIFITGKDSGPKKIELVSELNKKGRNILIVNEDELYKILDSINN